MRWCNHTEGVIGVGVGEVCHGACDVVLFV